jgi:hypothetical protein
MADLNPRTIAAKFRLGMVSVADLTRYADELLNRGHYTLALGELATTTDTNWFVIRDRFEMALKELGFPVPTEDEAAQILASPHLGDLVEGRKTPYKALCKFAWESSQYLHPQVDMTALLTRPLTKELTRLLDRYRKARTRWWSLHRATDAECDRRQKYLDGPTKKKARALLLQWHGAALAACAAGPGGESVVAVARRIGSTGEYASLPVLADALEEAGCADPDVLQHCRGPREHPKTCWVIDLLLAAGEPNVPRRE